MSSYTEEAVGWQICSRTFKVAGACYKQIQLRNIQTVEAPVSPRIAVKAHGCPGITVQIHIKAHASYSRKFEWKNNITYGCRKILANALTPVAKHLTH